MPEQNAISNAVPTASDVRQALRYLACKGAYGVQAPGESAADFMIHVEGEADALASIPASTVAQARSRGWVP